MSSFERLAGYPLQFFDFPNFIRHISDAVMKDARLCYLERSQGKSLYSSVLK